MPTSPVPTYPAHASPAHVAASLFRRCLFGAAVAALLCPCSSAAGAPPNVVWLTVEDMSPWLPCYGDHTVATPNLDRFAARSVRYTNAFATSPVCAPARSSLITGMYATRIGTMHMRTGNPSSTALKQNPEAYKDIPNYQGAPPAFVRCFPETLRAAGYYCTNNSKTDYQFRAPATVWDESSGRAHWRRRRAGQPFFAVFNYNGTHESQAFPESRRRPEKVAPADVPIPPLYPDTPAVRDALARTYNNIAEMDGWVGDRIKELEDAGLLENTCVFFYSDHGVGLPRGKRSPYDLGTRVPLLVRMPDESGAGTTDDRVVQFVDFGPTTLSLAGIDPDERMDGAPFLGEHRRQGGGYAFAHADRFDAVYDRARSVSDGRYRYVRNDATDRPYLIANTYRERIPMTADLYALRGSGPQRPEQWQVAATSRPKEELYDSQNDPWEVKNLVEDPALREKLAELRSALDGWIDSTGDLGLVLPESRMVRERLWPPNGEQPATAEPQVDLADGVVTLRSATEGASLGYRYGGRGPWRVYTGPFEVKPGRLNVVAHRIGWKPAKAEFRVQL